MNMYQEEGDTICVLIVGERSVGQPPDLRFWAEIIVESLVGHKRSILKIETMVKGLLDIILCM